MKARSRHFCPGRAAIAALLVGMVLLLNAMAACHGLHKLIHRDADTAGHECAVTMFAHGQVDSAAVDVSVTVPAVMIEAAPQFVFSVFTSATENLPPGRAPPAVISPQV